MSRTELQSEIQRLMEAVPESVLEQVLEYLKEVNSSRNEEAKQAHLLNRILQEDRELLKRLAQ